MDTPESLLSKLFSLPAGSSFGVSHSGSTWVATFSVATPNGPKRWVFNRSVNTDPMTALSLGVDSALASVQE